MTHKATVRFTDTHYAFAKRLVAEGQYASISSVVAAGLAQMTRDEEERDVSLRAMRNEIGRRLATPLDQFIDLEGDDLFDRTHALLKA